MFCGICSQSEVEAFISVGRLAAFGVVIAVIGNQLHWNWW